MKGRIGELVYMAEDYADSMVEEGADFHDAYTEILTHSIIEECIRVLQNR
jgi:argininosuccinate lyase